MKQKKPPQNGTVFRLSSQEKRLSLGHLAGADRLGGNPHTLNGAVFILNAYTLEVWLEGPLG